MSESKRRIYMFLAALLVVVILGGDIFLHLMRFP